ncbi:MAG: response regulator [Myxococcales bacterium]|nr:response regulator [Myxococcales bacterium]
MKTILVVDDEVDIAATLAEFLELSGYRVVVAHDGREGLQKALEATPDLVITDLMMPHMDGDELVARLRENAATKEIPVVMMSATRRLFVAPYLRKPFRADQLLKTVEEALTAPSG